MHFILWKTLDVLNDNFKQIFTLLKYLFFGFILISAVNSNDLQ